ncbi:MAG TPA: hypothetical protein VF117_06515, partial [Gammaproteobacteria bacterium]
WTSQNPRPADGQTYILVYAAPGEEGFNDINGDGVFDAGDTFTDQGEIFAGASSSYQSGDNYFDFNQDGVYTPANGKWDGVNCQDTSRCGNSQTAVGGFICLVMAGSDAIMTASTTSVTASPTNVNYSISDVFGNTLPKGTTITLVSSNLTNASATMTPSSYTVGNVGCGGVDPGISVAVLKTTAGTPSGGSFYLEAKTPGGTVTDSQVVSINIP